MCILCNLCDIARRQVFNQCRKLDDYFEESDNRGIEQWFKVEFISALRQMNYSDIQVHKQPHDLSFRAPEVRNRTIQIELKAGSYRGNAKYCYDQLIKGACQNPGIDCIFLGRFGEDELEADICRKLLRHGRCRIVCLGKVTAKHNWWIGHLRQYGAPGSLPRKAEGSKS
jgi:hypothetical protein